MKVLLCGGGGFLGSHIVEELHSRGHEGMVLDPDKVNFKLIEEATNRKFTTYWGGTHSKQMLQTLLEQKPDEIVYLAGISHTVSSVIGQEETFKAGVLGLAILYDVLNKLKMQTRVCIASSSLTSGVWDQREASNINVVENDEQLLWLGDCYHQYIDNKIAMEMLCHSNACQSKDRKSVV